MVTAVTQLTRQLQAIVGKAVDAAEHDPDALVRAIRELTTIRDGLTDQRERRIVQSYIARLREPLSLRTRAS